MRSSTDLITIPGRAFPARSSREVPASLIVGPDSVVLQSNEGTLFTHEGTDPPQFDAPVGRAPRRLTLPDGTLFETEDRAAVDLLSEGSLGQHLHQAERFRPRLILVIALGVLGVLAVFRYALPALVVVAVWLTPAPLERAIDAGSIQGFDLAVAEPTRLPVGKQQEIQRIFQDLLAELPERTRERSTYVLEFRDVPSIGANALALPGGTIVMTDDLVTRFDDPDILGGVLAHEIGHVVSRHGLEQLYRSVGVYVLIALIAGDTGPILEDILLEGGILLSFSNSREHEREADDFALQLADSAGYDPAGLLEFFQSLPDADESESNWLSTHPASGERMDAIREYLEMR